MRVGQHSAVPLPGFAASGIRPASVVCAVSGGSPGAASGYVAAEGAVRIDRVDPGGPAARAGLRDGDLIHAVNGRPLATVIPFWDAIDRGRPGALVAMPILFPRVRSLNLSTSVALAAYEVLRQRRERHH
jgi:S1-C subfamily serine protease